MSDTGEKHFDATPSRIAKAKREGNLPRATEFGANAAFIAAALGTLAVLGHVQAFARLAIERAARGSMPLVESAELLACALVPMKCALLAGVIASVLQNGGLQVVAIAVKPERMNPVAGLQRIASRETLTHGVRALVAFAVAAIVPTLRDVFSTSTKGAGALAIGAAAWSGSQHVVFAAAAVGMCFALAEYGVARRSWLEKLRMSFDEFKREMKDADGDPMARACRKALHRSLVRGALAKVKDATFVVVNPTHVAMALEYRPPDVPVPRVLVRAADELALRVRELAAAYGVPIVEDVALARMLYRNARVDEPIPYAQYVAVAEIVAALVRSGALA